MNFADFNIAAQEKFGIIEEIRKIIYDHSGSDKFIYNDFTQKMQLSPIWLSKISQYNSLKSFV